MAGLPAAKLLIAFEAAARHLSFSKAALELNVQQPAVSRQIGALEGELRAPLFIRSKPRLTLTAEGQELFAAVTAGFGGIAQAARRIASSAQHDRLVIDTSIGFAGCFLMRRLGDFAKRHPEIDLELVTRDQNAAFDDSDADVVVIFGEAGLPDSRSRLVFPEELLAVCAPGRLPGGRLLAREELMAERLLWLNDSYHLADWETYFGAPRPPEARRKAYNSYSIYLQAILDGEGIGLGWAHLLDDHFAAGSLRLASAHRVGTSRGYHCCVLDGSRNRQQALAFADWLVGLVRVGEDA